MSHEGIADFRSDTVTRPTPEMYEAMASAPLGDDVFGDDPTVRALEAYAAELFGKEAGLLMPSGTMGNQVAVRVHTRLGDELIVEETSHTFYYEQGGVAQLSGVQARALPGERGRIDLDRLAASVRPDDVHYPRTSLIVLEQTHNSSGGAVLPLDYLRSVQTLARERGLAVHLDGARVANAEAASEHTVAEFAACVDSVSCCLSKGLGAPVGTVLTGTGDFIAEARRVRKVFGGGMRQAGILAAAGLVALRDMRARLADDHARTAALARGFAAHDALDVVEPETNLLYVRCPERARALVKGMAARGVRGLALDGDTMRFVTHKDVDDDDVARAIAAMDEALEEEG